MARMLLFIPAIVGTIHHSCWKVERNGMLPTLGQLLWAHWNDTASTFFWANLRVADDDGISSLMRFCEVVGELSFPLQLSPEGYLGWKAYPTGDLLPCKSDSYGLSVCVPAKFICRSPSTQCNSILRWSLWRKVGLGNVMNVMALWRDTRELALFIPVYTKKKSCEYTARR